MIDFKFELLLAFQSFSLTMLGAFENVKNVALAMGLGGLAGGIILFVNHKRHLATVLAKEKDKRIVAYENRKFRRRAIVSAMIASAGCMMAALYWVVDVRIFAVFILMILGLLVAILGVALIDLFSVGLHQIATPDPKAHKAMVEEYLRQRKKADEQKQKNE